jgi:hypothetical protein
MTERIWIQTLVLRVKVYKPFRKWGKQKKIIKYDIEAGIRIFICGIQRRFVNRDEERRTQYKFVINNSHGTFSLSRGRVSHTTGHSPCLCQAIYTYEGISKSFRTESITE